MLRILISLFFAGAVPFARQLLFGDGVLDGDVYVQNLPAWEWFSRTLHSGQSLLWSPDILGGFPMAFTQWPLFYPPDLLLTWLLPPFYAYSWSIVLHIVLAGVLTYLYCRSIGLGMPAAILTAVSFQLSSEVVAGSSGFAARSAYLLPGILLSVELTCRKGWRYAPVTSLVVAAGLLGGHFQPILIELLAGATYGVFRLGLVTARSGARAALNVGVLLALSAALGVCGAAVRLLPTWEVTTLSTRAGGVSLEDAASGALQLPGLLLGYLIPLSRMGDVLPWGAPGYAGPAVLVLTIVCLRRLASQAVGRYFLGLGLVAALLSLGAATPFFWLTRLPLLSFFHEPSRFMMLTTFSLSVLGGMALDGFHHEVRRLKGSKLDRLAVLAVATGVAAVALFALALFYQYGAGALADSLRGWVQHNSLQSLDPSRGRMALAIVSLPLAVSTVALAARGKLSVGLLRWSLIALSVAVLVPVAAILNPPIGAAVLNKTPDTAQLLERQQGLYRAYSYQAGMALFNHLSFWGPPPDTVSSSDLSYRFEAEMLAPVINLRWGISEIDGYENLRSRYQDLVLRAIDGQPLIATSALNGRPLSLSWEQRLRLFRMYNTRYILSGSDLSQTVAGLSLVSHSEVDFGPASGAPASVYLLEVQNAMPRYYLVPSAIRSDNDADVLYSVALGKMDPRSVVALSDVEPGAVAATRMGTQATGTPGTWSVEPVSLQNTEVVLRVSNSEPAFLVTSDAYWPGWRAFVDGQEVPLARANVIGRALWIAKAGTHVVTFRFDPPEFAAGLTISEVATSIILGWLVVAAGWPRIRRGLRRVSLSDEVS